MKTSISALCLGGLLLCSGVAGATSVDVQQFATQTPTTYFVDQDANKYNSPYYRWNGQGWSWNHNPISGPITAASLNISAFDVDWVYGEVDSIYAYDNGVKTYVGSLTGDSDQWSYSTFNLGSNFFDDINNGLNVSMDIDVLHQGWAVTLTKSALSIDGGAIPDPTPGSSTNPVPEPGSVMLLGAGFLGLAAYNRRRKNA